MQKTIIRTFCALAVTLIVVTSAIAHDWKMSADIPFDFNVGDTRMTSGKYTVESVSNGAVVVRSAQGKQAALSLSNAVITPRYLNTARLIFNKYGEQYFLSTMSWPDGPSRTLPPANVE